MALLGIPAGVVIPTANAHTQTNALNAPRPTNERKDEEQSNGEFVLSGEITRILYRKEGYRVFLIRTDHPLAKEKKGEMVVVGDSSFGVGNQIRCEGRFVTHGSHGLQFKSDYIMPIIPDTDEKMVEYLKSGGVPGISPYLAFRLHKHLGDRLLDVLTQGDPVAIQKAGLMAAEAVQISNAWKSHQGIATIMRQLKSFNLGNRDAWNIWNTWKHDAIKVIEANPYRLTNIKGIGFDKAEQVARQMGFESGSDHRVTAAMRKVLDDHECEGHTRISHQDLVKKINNIVQTSSEHVTTVLGEMAKKEYIARYRVGDNLWYSKLTTFLREKDIAQHIKRLFDTPSPYEGKPFQVPDNVPLGDDQRRAVLMAPKSKMLVITGGPGVGKTHTTRTILDVLEKQLEANILLCAPTGRAAQRMAESTGRSAATIHRTLVWGQNDAGRWEFMHNKANPLECDVLVVDEASMKDTKMFHYVLQALPDHASLILLGDKDQLASVGAGSVLKDLIESRRIPVVRLNKPYRFKDKDKDSKDKGEHYIITNAHRINSGKMPIIDNANSKDWYFLAGPDEAIGDKIVELVTQSLPQRFGYTPDDIQVLAPMKPGSCGIHAINRKIQSIVNPRRDQEVIRKENRDSPETAFRPGDRVMMLKNNTPKQVFNGDVGKVVHAANFQVVVRFDETDMVFRAGELHDLQHAWATTIHKSQGSEYPVVVLPFTMQHKHMLARNLVYTGYTRGKELIIGVGDIKALEQAVKTNHHAYRQTGLATQLRYYLPKLEDAEEAPTQDDATPANATPPEDSARRTRMR